MQFLLIMGIGTLVAIWIVANQPKRRGRGQWIEDRDMIVCIQKPAQTPASAKDISETFCVDEFDYMRKAARYEDDPQHWPPPLSPPPRKIE
jgi:hypothetical protein